MKTTIALEIADTDGSCRVGSTDGLSTASGLVNATLLNAVFWLVCLIWLGL